MTIRKLESYFIGALSPFRFGLGTNLKIFCARVFLLCNAFLAMAIIGVGVLVSVLFPWILIIVGITLAVIFIRRWIFFRFGWDYLRIYKFLSSSIVSVTLSLVQSFLDIFSLEDIFGRTKESLLRKMEVDAKASDAEAQKKLLEAAKANIANFHKEQYFIAHIEQELKEAEVAKTKAEAEAILKDVQRRLLALTETKIRFLEVIAKLQEKGGDIFLDLDDLNKILEAGLPSEDDENKSDHSTS